MVLTVGPGSHAASGRTADGPAQGRRRRRDGSRRARPRDHHRARHPRLVGVRPGPRQRARRRPSHRDVVFAAPDWSLEEAAAAMVRGGFRHLIVLDGGETVGILSVRDIVRCWTDDGAICPVPARRPWGEKGWHACLGSRRALPRRQGAAGGPSICRGRRAVRSSVSRCGASRRRVHAAQRPAAHTAQCIAPSATSAPPPSIAPVLGAERTAASRATARRLQPQGDRVQRRAPAAISAHREPAAPARRARRGAGHRATGCARRSATRGANAHTQPHSSAASFHGSHDLRARSAAGSRRPAPAPRRSSSRVSARTATTASGRRQSRGQSPVAVASAVA